MKTGPTSQSPEPAKQQAMIDSMAQDWLLLMTSGEPSDDDRARFHRWLDENPQHLQAYDELSGLWADIDSLRNAFASPAAPENGFTNEPRNGNFRLIDITEVDNVKKSTAPLRHLWAHPSGPRISPPSKTHSGAAP
jgi:hypothetical protein